MFNVKTMRPMPAERGGSRYGIDPAPTELETCCGQRETCRPCVCYKKSHAKAPRWRNIGRRRVLLSFRGLTLYDMKRCPGLTHVMERMMQKWPCGQPHRHNSLTVSNSCSPVGYSESVPHKTSTSSGRYTAKRMLVVDACQFLADTTTRKHNRECHTTKWLINSSRAHEDSAIRGVFAQRTARRVSRVRGGGGGGGGLPEARLGA